MMSSVNESRVAADRDRKVGHETRSHRANFFDCGQAVQWCARASIIDQFVKVINARSRTRFQRSG